MKRTNTEESRVKKAERKKGTHVETQLYLQYIFSQCPGLGSVLCRLDRKSPHIHIQMVLKLGMEMPLPIHIHTKQKMEWALFWDPSDLHDYSSLCLSPLWCWEYMTDDRFSGLTTPAYSTRRYTFQQPVLILKKIHIFCKQLPSVKLYKQAIVSGG